MTGGYQVLPLLSTVFVITYSKIRCGDEVGEKRAKSGEPFFEYSSARENQPLILIRVEIHENGGSTGKSGSLTDGSKSDRFFLSWDSWRGRLIKYEGWSCGCPSVSHVPLLAGYRLCSAFYWHPIEPFRFSEQTFCLNQLVRSGARANSKRTQEGESSTAVYMENLQGRTRQDSGVEFGQATHEIWRWAHI